MNSTIAKDGDVCIMMRGLNRESLLLGSLNDISMHVNLWHVLIARRLYTQDLSNRSFGGIDVSAADA